MLTEIHEAVQRLLYERGGIPSDEVDVRFEAPTKEWIDSLTRPTISVFLCDVRENTELRRADYQVSRENGRAKYQLPPRRIDLQYMVSVITTEIEDEYRLLWRALATLLRHPQFPVETLPEELRAVEPPLVTRVAQPDDIARPMGDTWAALGVPPRPTLTYLITAPLDLEHTFDTPLALTRTVRYGTTAPGAHQEVHHEIGGVVRSRDGQPLAGVVVTQDGRALVGSVTDESGRFALRSVPTGTVTIRAASADRQEATVTVTVPSDSYDITME